MEIEVENTKYMEIEYITDIGEEVTDEQKKLMWLKHGNGNPEAEMPLFIDEEFKWKI